MFVKWQTSSFCDHSLTLISRRELFLRKSNVEDQLDDREAELEDTERRRNMTDAEIMEELRRKPKKVRSKMKFLQKYYHKGTFPSDCGF